MTIRPDGSRCERGSDRSTCWICASVFPTLAATVGRSSAASRADGTTGVVGCGSANPGLDAKVSTLTKSVPPTALRINREYRFKTVSKSSSGSPGANFAETSSSFDNRALNGNGSQCSFVGRAICGSSIGLFRTPKGRSMLCQCAVWTIEHEAPPGLVLRY
jgi:hypothetical protein